MGNDAAFQVTRVELTVIKASQRPRHVLLRLIEVITFAFRVLSRAWLCFLQTFRTLCNTIACGFWLAAHAKTIVSCLSKLIYASITTWLEIVTFATLDKISEESAGAPILDFVDERVARHVKVNLQLALVLRSVPLQLHGVSQILGRLVED